MLLEHMGQEGWVLQPIESGKAIFGAIAKFSGSSQK